MGINLFPEIYTHTDRDTILHIHRTDTQSVKFEVELSHTRRMHNIAKFMRTNQKQHATRQQSQQLQQLQQQQQGQHVAIHFLLLIVLIFSNILCRQLRVVCLLSLSLSLINDLSLSPLLFASLL